MFIESLARLNYKLQKAGSKMTVVAFIITPVSTNSYTIDALKGQAVTKQLQAEYPMEARVHDRFARLGVIAQILRDPVQRERYDFFYKNGVPKWRGESDCRRAVWSDAKGFFRHWILLLPLPTGLSRRFPCRIRFHIR